MVNFFKSPLGNSHKMKKSKYSRSNQKQLSPLPSRSLQNSSKRQRTEASSKSLVKEHKNIFENSMYGKSGSNNKLSRRNKSVNDNTPSMGHTQRSFWARQEVSDPMDFIERAKGFNGIYFCFLRILSFANLRFFNIFEMS